MRALRLAAEGARGLGDNALRTLFMMAGTTLGIAALVVVVAIGQGTERTVLKRVQNFGPRAMMLIAGGGKDLPPPDMNVATLTLQDAEAIRQQIDGLEIVTPMAWRFRMNVRRGGEGITAVAWGVEPDWHEAWNWPAASGSGITDQDVATRARVCVIGRTVQRELFGDADPLGHRIYLNQVPLTVKGVLEQRGTSPMGGDFDRRVILPITTAMRRVLNVDHLGAIRLLSRDPARMARQAEEVRALMRRRHRITPPQEDDFRIITPDVIAEVARGIARTLSVLLLTLAGVSLLVGGVVMMNILLMSVRQRVREIALRRALGATRRDIFLQFLTESLAVTLLGMALGCALGGVAVAAMSRASDMALVLSPRAFALAAGFALLLGTVFGVQPARRAALLAPVEALR